MAMEKTDYRVVNADKLDADLGTVADAIRTRAGTTEPLTFPDGMVAAVTDIPDYLEQKATGTLKEYSNDRITGKVSMRAFAYADNMVSVSLPNALSLGDNVFQNCTSLANVNIPKVTFLGLNVFLACSSLVTLNLPSITKINNQAFQNAKGLVAVVIRTISKVCELASSNAFTGTPIASGTGYIYVPSVLVDSYKAATNWSTYADQIRAIEDYPEITGGAT